MIQFRIVSYRNSKIFNEIKNALLNFTPMCFSYPLFLLVCSCYAYKRGKH